MKTFLLLHDFQQNFDMLTDEEAGQMIKAIFTYERTSEEPDFSDRAMQMAFHNIKRFLDSNRENYEKVCQRRAESAYKRWNNTASRKASTKKPAEKTMQKDANACNCMQMDAFAGNNNSNVIFNAESNADVNINDDADVNAYVDDNADINSVTDVDVCVNDDFNTEKNNAVKNYSVVSREQNEKNSHTDTQRKALGEFKNVFLNEEEYLRLKKSFPDADERIESLSAYIQSTGKIYRDHYAQLLNWQLYTRKSPPNYARSTAPKPSPPKMPGERREPTFDVSFFTKKAVGIKYVPPT